MSKFIQIVYLHKLYKFVNFKEIILTMYVCMYMFNVLGTGSKYRDLHNDQDGARAEHCGARIYLGSLLFRRSCSFHPIACKQRLLVAPWNIKG